MDRRRSPPPRQQRRVDVDHAEARCAQHHVGDDPAVGRDDAEVGVERAEGRQEAFVLQPLGLQHRNAALDGELLHATGRQMMATAARTVRLRDHAHDDVPARQQGSQRRHGELGRAEERDAQRRVRHHWPARFILWILRRICWRLMPRSRSTNVVPSRWSISCWSARASRPCASIACWLALAVQARQHGPGRTQHGGGKAGHAQAAFLLELRSAARDELRVDADAELLRSAPRRDVDDEQAQRDRPPAAPRARRPARHTSSRSCRR